MAAGILLLPPVADAVTGLSQRLAPGEQCRVVQVIDGDTVSLWCAGVELERARLLGFDTPELFSPGCPAELAAATQAKWRLRSLVWAADEVQIRRRGEDRYGRPLVWLLLDGRDVANTMIAEGHARPYDGGARAGWCA